MTKKKREGKGRPPTEGFVSEYIHYRTKKLMRASDYGYKAWPFGKKR